MYRLMLYYVIVLIIVGVFFSILHILPFNPLSLIFSTVFITFVCFITNKIFSSTFNAPTNVESVYISSFILALILSPIQSIQDMYFFFWAGVLTIGSKYIFAIHKKHIFNPVVFGVILTSFGLQSSASWWVGTLCMAPFIILGGLLVIRKMRREDLFFTYALTALFTYSFFVLFSNGNIVTSLWRLLFSSSFFFLAFAMLSEPLTTPPTKTLQIMYGALVGFLFTPQLHAFGIYSTPELALFLGNIFSYLVSPKYKLLVRLKEKIQHGVDILDFQFYLDKKLAFTPGQYMEWTMPHKHPDNRGNRRYFTIASSPTEDTLRVGVKFYTNGSSFKKNLMQLNDTSPILAGQLAGDFTLPINPKETCVFIAGGIGITPFRSMIKYLLDTKEPRQIVLFYSNKLASEILYEDIFKQAYDELGITTIYTLTDVNALPLGWQGNVGRINALMLQQHIPDIHDRTYYLSGPHALVVDFEKTLRSMGIHPNKIRKDFFPGFV